jgi:hypothetical protein
MERIRRVHRFDEVKMKLIDYDSTGLIGRVLAIADIEEMPEIPPYVIPNDPRIFERIEVGDDVEVSFDKQYVSNGLIEQRPTWNPVVSTTTIPADGQTSIKVSGIPSAVKVNLFGPATDSWAGAAGDIEVAVGLPGEYKLYIEAFPYQRIEVNFNAT